ncbi:DNA mismatch repair protein MutS [Aequorivita sp. F47161]|uniref:DNA mismatch repair protein MutS n=1 Tax=Aequorivita vitellina TaxID=2874475 RepID=A0A9X1QU07_9FLAO|nr:Smr/MutS family protein [Aequorivita vitellina]MCG2418898.1 DNA mismatch repair protein MutS [Aequorivita vitellina]MCZ4318938.1 DNA mismatch repair protein MutS [Aequorivita viscosa]
MKVHDKVSVLDDAISGVVTAVKGNEVTIITTDGFELDFFKHELIVMDGSLSKRKLAQMDVSEVLSEKESKKPGKTKRIKPKERSLPPMVVDLHINQLVPKTRGMDNYEMLTIQLDTAKRQLDFAISKRIQKVVFIHGVGEGVLRAELEFLFNRYENLKFYDADYQKYGRGATEVYIYQNVK